MLLIYKIIALFGISLIFIDSNVAYNMLVFSNFLIVKFFISFNIIVFLEDIVWFFRYVLLKKESGFVSWWKEKSEIQKKEIEWISIYDLVSLIYETWGLRNADFIDTFGANNILFKKIGDILEKKQILIRWEKNARILNPEITIEECIEKLSKPLLQKESDNTYSYNQM